MEILIVVGAIIVGLLLIGLLLWLAIALGVVAFLAYLVSSATGIPFHYVFIAGVILMVVSWMFSLSG